MGQEPFASAEAEKAYYKKFIEDIASGKPLTEEQIRHHVALQNRGTRSGLDIGLPAPEFRLQDQAGKERSRDELTGPNGLVVVFSRTVLWCPYCRNHIKEADFVAPFLASRGVNVVCITPDELDLHRKYAEANGLGIPLLSDPERQAIKGFDVLNGNIPKDIVGQRPDVPFPGYFVLDRNGIVTDKAFLTDYQFRQSPSVAIARRFGWLDRPSVEAEAPSFHARLAISSDRGFAGHQFGFQCSVQPCQPWGQRHGTAKVEVTLSGPLIEGEQRVELAVSGTVDQGSVEVNGIVPVRWSAPPDFERMKGLEHMREGGLREGAYMLEARVTVSRTTEDGSEEIDGATMQLPIHIMAEILSPVPLG